MSVLQGLVAYFSWVLEALFQGLVRDSGGLVGHFFRLFGESLNE